MLQCRHKDSRRKISGRSGGFVFLATFVTSEILFLVSLSSAKTGEISDRFKCFENFVPLTLGLLINVYAAELHQLVLDTYLL